MTGAIGLTDENGSVQVCAGSHCFGFRRGWRHADVNRRWRRCPSAAEWGPATQWTVKTSCRNESRAGRSSGVEIARHSLCDCHWGTTLGNWRSQVNIGQSMSLLMISVFLCVSPLYLRISICVCILSLLDSRCCSAWYRCVQFWYFKSYTSDVWMIFSKFVILHQYFAANSSNIFFLSFG